MGNKKQRAKASQPQQRGKAKSSGPRAKSSKNVENKAKGAAAKDADADARRTGLRGAAPWAARHAAKHAAEARARNAQPPPPGSARATLRVPEKAEQIKAKVAELHNLLVQIRALRKNLADRFFDLGKLLATIRERRLYEAKGYNSFESFLEREVDLSKGMLLRLERMPRVFHEEIATEIGLDGLVAALDAIDAVAAGARPAAPAVTAPPHLPLKPPARRK
jgi:hypothetical protein